MNEATTSVQVRDVDALFDGPEQPGRFPLRDDVLEERWDDHAMRWQRKEFLRVLLDLVATSTRSRWDLLRTSRHAVVSTELRTRGIETQPAVGAVDPDTPSRARKTLRTLAVSRAETPCNGAAGPLPWAGVPGSSRSTGRGSMLLSAVRRDDVDDFDSTDPHAWEYYAYNLARAGGSFEQVEVAHRRACEHDPGNPLYRGRWIGHLAAHGQDVVGLFGKWLAVYREDWGEAGMRWFADPVLRASRRSRQGDVYDRICARYGFILRRSPRLRRLMEGHGRRVATSSRSRS